MTFNLFYWVNEILWANFLHTLPLVFSLIPSLMVLLNWPTF